MLIVPQLLTCTPIGAMKSLTSAVNDVEARLLTNALPKFSQIPGGKTPAAVRLMAVSPNVPVGTLVAFPDRNGSVTASVLTAPIESLLFRVCCLPQHGSELLEKHWLAVLPAAAVSHVSSPRVGFPPPLEKSKVTSRSPAVRFSVTAPMVLPSNPEVACWLISKSTFASPLLLVRSQPRYRKVLPLLDSDAS